MSLLTRLVAPAPGEVKLSVHQFMAAINEFRLGAPGATANRIFTHFDLSTAERSQLTDWFVGQVQTGNVTREQVHDALMLGEDSFYSVQEVKDRLGL